jgi:TonB-like protein
MWKKLWQDCGKSLEKAGNRTSSRGELRMERKFLTFSCEGILSACGIETGLETKRNKAVARLRVMAPTKSLIYALAATLLVFAYANHSLGQGEKKPGKSKEEKELVARCKSRLIKSGPAPEPNKWEWGKDETYRGGPVISYTIEEDGNVTNVRLKRSSGVRKIDAYYLASVRGRKYQAMPGCPGIETTESMTIDFH